MRKSIIGVLGTALVATSTLVGQPQPARVPQAVPPEQRGEPLTRFNLDFPGGTPKQLVDAITKASGKPLNAIIPDELTNTKLPPLKMNNVDVARLFLSLSAASERRVSVPTRPGPSPQAYQLYPETYGFRTQEPIKDDSVWYFYNQKALIQELGTDCRFYQLAPYLETYKVEDITTAIQTGWKMLGETNLPTISYHKDTKLLIAVGDPSKLQLIESVLQQLGQAKPQPSSEGVSAAKSGATAKP